MGDGDAVIKQGIKKPEKEQDKKLLGERPSYWPFVRDDDIDLSLNLAEFEGWGIEMKYIVR